MKIKSTLGELSCNYARKAARLLKP